MKTIEDYQKFADELKVLCEKHGVYLIGSCYSEGIYGEIELVDIDKISPKDEERINFTVSQPTWMNGMIILGPPS
jgi:hypothetical protein